MKSFLIYIVSHIKKNHLRFENLLSALGVIEQPCKNPTTTKVLMISSYQNFSAELLNENAHFVK